MKNRLKELLLQLLFAFLGFIILILPFLLGLFIYPNWLIFICAIVSPFWFGPWLYKQYLIHKLRKNNPLKKR